MEEADDPLLPPPFSIVCLVPARCPSARRLSSHFTPSRPVLSAGRLARLSLQGRLLNAEEASSAGAIGGGLGRDEALAWELFTPMQRFLLVAVIGVAVSESKKNRVISRLKKSVDLRDQVLSSMQLKLDTLCDELNNIKSPAKGGAVAPLRNDSGSPCRDAFGCDNIKFVDCGCWHCDRHQDLYASLVENTAVKISKGDEVLQYKSPMINVVGEQEERRMSDLSDWASSVTSTADMQINSFTVEIDIFNLKRECEEKDATIKELTIILQSTDTASSKRIAELEDIIRRKNSAITRLKKDMVVLDQKIVQLTRLRRPSSASFKSDNSPLPLMLNNIVYDMDSTTSPSSSDSDSSPKNRLHSPAVEIQVTPVQYGDPASAMNPKPAPGNLARLSYRHSKSRPVSPLKEVSINQKSHGTSPRAGQFPSSVNFKKIRRQPQSSLKEGANKKRWA